MHGNTEKSEVSARKGKREFWTREGDVTVRYFFPYLLALDREKEKERLSGKRDEMKCIALLTRRERDREREKRERERQVRQKKMSPLYPFRGFPLALFQSQPRKKGRYE